MIKLTLEDAKGVQFAVISLNEHLLKPCDFKADFTVLKSEFSLQMP